MRTGKLDVFVKLTILVSCSRVPLSMLGCFRRASLVENLAVLVAQLRNVGVREVFADGSFVEDKDHPNDIDGYFVCDLQRLASGNLQRELNLIDPHKVWTWDPTERRPFRGYPKKQLPMWHQYRVELYPPLRAAVRHSRQLRKRARAPVGVSTLAAGRQTQGDHQDRRTIMIRNEAEYQEAVKRLKEERARYDAHEQELVRMGLKVDEVKRAMDPLRSFNLQLEEEVEAYERLKRGDLGELDNLHGLGRTLVALRIALGLTQRQLAERLGVNESQVSRDERNEYQGITVDRASRILDALGVTLRSVFQTPVRSGASEVRG